MANENQAVDELEKEVQETKEEQGETCEAEECDVNQEEICEDAKEPDTEKEGKEKKIFGKKKKDKKDPKDEKIEELTDRLQRTMAEFDNFRKRTTAEKASMYVVGAKEVIEKMLPVVDNFERALASENLDMADPFVDGMNKIYKQLLSTLTELGVQEISGVGSEFDPNLHNAVMHIEDENEGENLVVEVFQKGYTYKDFVVRHSMVKVAN